jgi:hypothetical protein
MAHPAPLFQIAPPILPRSFVATSSASAGVEMRIGHALTIGNAD